MKNKKVPLRFGDVDQIEALRRERLRIEQEEEDAKKTRYRVCLSFSGSYETEVLAHNEEEAEDIARDEMCMDESEIDDISCDGVYES